MANCTECGAPIKDGVKFCTECGAAAPIAKPASISVEQNTPIKPQPEQKPPQAHQQQIPTQQPSGQVYAQPQQTYAQPQPQPIYQQPVYAQPAPVYAQPQAEQEPGPDSPYGLISTWGYIGIMLLLCIPIIGFILMIVWACGGCKKKQKRNLCRAMIIVTVFTLVISLILGFAFNGFIYSLIDTAKDSISESSGTKEDNEPGGIAGLFSGLTGDSAKSNDEPSEQETENLLSGLFGGLFNGDSAENDEGDDISGLFSGLISGDLSGLMDEVDDINKEASKHSNGWPSDLPDYPDGTMDEVEDYRTLITETSAESMWNYIETLKQKGYKFQDFYEIGMSESDMKSIDAWWGTNGKWYLSISYADGTVTVDHTTELPNLSGLFG